MGQKYSRGAGYGAKRPRTATAAAAPWYKNRLNLAILIGFSVAGLIWILGSLDTSSDAATLPAAGMPAPVAAGGGDLIYRDLGPWWQRVLIAAAAVAAVAMAIRFVSRFAQHRAELRLATGQGRFADDQSGGVREPVISSPYDDHTAEKSHVTAVGGIGVGKRPSLPASPER